MVGANTVTATLVSGDFSITGTGALLTNYTLPTGPVSATATITALPLTASIIGNPTKFYDATTAATLTTANYQVSGTIAGEAVTVVNNLSLNANYDSRHVQIATTVTKTGLVSGDLAITGPNTPLLTNYVLPTTASGTGHIMANALTATITGPTKAYDATTAATLGTENFSIQTGNAEVITILKTTGTFDNKNVGTGKTVTTTLANPGDFSISGAGAVLTDYSLPLTASGTGGSITTASITGSFTASNKVYDGGTSATILTRTFTTAPLGTDSLTLLGGTATFASKAVGTGKAVHGTGFTLGGTDAGNYTLVQPADATANITAKALTVVGITASDKVYNGTTSATLSGPLTATLIGIVSGDTVSVLSTGTGTFVTKTVGLNKTVNITGTTLQGAEAGNYSVNPTTAQADITPAALTVTASSVGKIYDGTDSAPVVLNGTPLGSDVVTFSFATATFATKNIGSQTVTVTGITLGGADGANYLPNSTATATASITVRLVTVTADAKVKTVGQPDPLLTYHVTSGTVVPGDSFTGALSRTAGELLGTYPINVGSLTLGTNYSQTYVGANLTIVSQTILTVTGITVTNKTYDGTTTATPDFTNAQLVGVISPDQVTLVTAGASGAFSNPNVGTSIDVDISGLTLTGADAAKYILEQPMASANITAKALTVTGVTANDKVYDGTTTATFDISSAVLVGVIPADSGQVVLDGSATGTFPSKNVGTYTINVTGLGLNGPKASNYSLTPPSATGAEITAATVTGSFTSPDKTYDGTDSATILTPAVGGVIGTDVVTLDGGTATFADKNVNTGGIPKTVTGTGFTLGGADGGNYVLSAAPITTTANITAATVTGSFTADDKPYVGTDSAVIATRTVTPFGTDDLTLDGGTATFANKNVGVGKTVSGTGFSLGGLDAGNYLLAPGTLTTTASITPATVTGSFTSTSKVYDGQTSAETDNRTITSGVIGTEDVTLVGGTATFGDKNVGVGKTVTGTGFTLGGTDAGNYVLSTTPITTTADITPATLTFTAAGVDKVFDGTTTATVTFSDDRVSGDVFTYVYTADFANIGPGTGISVAVSGISITGTDAGNYNLALTTATTTADITQTTALTVTGITVSSKPYDGTTTAIFDASAYHLVGIAPGDTVTLVTTGATFAFDGKGVGSHTIIVTGLTLGGADAGKYTLTQPTNITAIISAKGLTVTGLAASNKMYDGGTVATLTGTAALSGLVPGDAVTLGGTAVGAFAGKGVGSGLGVTVTGLSISGTDAGNYTFTQQAGLTANITPVTLSGNFGAASKEYDGGTSATIVSRTIPTGVIPGDVVTLLGGTATFADKNVGNGKVVTGTGFTLVGADAGNYVLSSSTITTTASITAKSLTVTANNAARGFGQPNPVFTASYSGFANGETLATSGVTGSPVLTTTATQISPQGTYPITAASGTLASGNYSFAMAPGTLLITGASVATTTFAAGSTVPSTVFGQATTFVSQVVSGVPGLNPTGTVLFFDGTTLIGSGALVVNGFGQDVAVFSTGSLSVGTHQITMAYPANGSFLASSSSPAITQGVSAATTTSTLVVRASSNKKGYILSTTASAVAPGADTPTGSVTFFINNKSFKTVSMTNGLAQLSISAQTGYRKTIKSVYNTNSGSYTGSTSNKVVLKKTPKQLGNKSLAIASAAPTVTASAAGNGQSIAVLPHSDNIVVSAFATMKKWFNRRGH